MNNYVDIEEMTKTKEKINLYTKEELMKFDSIKEIFNSLNNVLDIDSSSYIQNIQFDLIKKLEIIKKIHYNNCMIIEKNIDKYIGTSIKTNQIFRNINKRN